MLTVVEYKYGNHCDEAGLHDSAGNEVCIWRARIDFNAPDLKNVEQSAQKLVVHSRLHGEWTKWKKDDDRCVDDVVYKVAQESG